VSQVMVVTGATNGIGLITAQALAATGARVVLVGRSEQRLAQAVAHIQASTPDASLDMVCADLSVQHEVYTVANHIKANYKRIDVLINNAGAYYATRQLSADGIEMTWALNHMAPFVLTNALLDLLRQSAPARIITVSSMAHQSAKINFDDIQGAQRYSGWNAYAQSKLANILFTYELADRLQQTDITVNCLHPGFVATGFAQNNIGFMANAMALLQRFFAISPEKGAQTSVFLATSPSVNTVTGRYFVDSTAVASSKISYDVTSRRRLWELSQKLVRD
jgi:NAD(P)-dependent dehydrogenase (short-subunit alcohol dehydrogenase family)